MRVVLASLATATPMGQQEYEQQLAAHLPGAGVDVRAVRVRSMRSTLVADARLPLGVAVRLPLVAQHALARGAYGSADLVHRCDLRLPAARAEVVNVHDLAPLRFPDEGSIAPRALASLSHARAVICPSRFAADELRELAGIDDAIVIPLGLDPAVWDEPDEGMLDGLDLPRRFVLHSGGATQRKNLDALAAAWRRLAVEHPDVGLVLCGPPDERRSLLFADLPRVRLLGRVARPLHLALICAATVVVVPSTYEGFGFPALEAMALGTAVVAANAASLPEVCGTAALLVEPDAVAVAAGIATVLTDDDVRAQLVAGGRDRAAAFSWQRSAAEHAEVYRRASVSSASRAG